MSEQNVPIQRTVIDMRTYARALARAWQDQLGELPTKRQAGVLWAQYGIETGAGQWAWNWNIGNVKHVPGDGYDYIMLPNTWEMVAGRKVILQPPDPGTWFRSFPDLDTAMSDQFRLLRGKRYASAWEGVELGDCGVFARKLKAAGYFTADANAYAQGMRAHFDRWMKSDAFDQALADLQTPATEPELPANDIVHPELYPEPDDEPPPSAA